MLAHLLLVSRNARARRSRLRAVLVVVCAAILTSALAQAGPGRAQAAHAATTPATAPPPIYLNGLNRLGADAAEGGQGAVDDVQATSFPVNFASTMTWDPQLTYQETTAISDEARGFLGKSLFGTGQNNLGPSASDYGDLTFWAPTVNLDRDPRWGRTDEAFGEDPFLNGQMSGAVRQWLPGQHDVRAADDAVPQGRGDGEALRDEQRRGQPDLG